MQIQNTEIAEQFNRVADLLEIDGANPFRVRAYRNAARTLRGTSENIADLVNEEHDLTRLPAIGKDLASKIREIVNTGHLSLLDQVERRVPGELRELLRIPSIGPKRVGQLYKKCGVRSLEDLRTLAESKRILDIPGFGEKTRAGILEELKKLRAQEHPRLTLLEAQEAADLVVRHMEKIPLQRLAVAGSFRRRAETVGDLDILATSENSAEVIAHFLKLQSIEKVISKGITRSTVVLRSGVQVDLRVVPDVNYGAALLYLTGSKAHNIALRTIAHNNGLKINEYGIFKGTKRLASRTEADMYRTLGLSYVEPELRENRGEIEAAARRTLPELIDLEDIQGDLHIHSSASDGTESIRDLALTARDLGYSYLGITDHSKRLTIAHGLGPQRLLQQINEIDQLNASLRGITILKSIEVDILEDGSLDLPNEILERLDFTVCAVHSHFHLSKEKQTERILRAMQNPYFTILAHPLARLIGRRAPLDLDFEQIIAMAKKMNRVLEINAQPERMDLSDIYCRMAREAGVKMSIATDAHNISQLGYMEFGVGQARRGWLEKDDVINTLSLNELKNIFKPRPPSRPRRRHEEAIWLS